MSAICDDLKLAQLGQRLADRHVRFGLLWLLGVETGLRISDLLALRVKDVKRNLHVTEKKTGKKRQFNLSPKLLAQFRSYIRKYRLKKADFLFYSAYTRTDRPVSRQWVWKIIARTATEMGLFSIGTHSARKTYAENLFARTGSVEAVQRALKHKHKKTTEAYLAGREVETCNRQETGKVERPYFSSS